MKSNIYDFDKTIYDGDSTVDFYKYCLWKHKRIITCLPFQLRHALMYKLKKETKEEFKTGFFVFLKKLDHIDQDIDDFWCIHEKNIKTWYLKQKKETDIIISASPTFLLEPICKKLDIKHLMASRVDKRTGDYDGMNCHGKEKVRRLYEKYPDVEVDGVYSDSMHDRPILDLSDHSYVVKGKRRIPYEEYKEKHNIH